MGGLDDYYSTSPPLKRLKLYMQTPPSSPPPSVMPSGISGAQEDAGCGGKIDANVGPMGLLKRSELVRIIIQSLYALGYKKSALLLEDESGISLQSSLVLQFKQQILDGKWEDSMETMRFLLPDSSTFSSAVSLILQQKFFEQISVSASMEALRTLRSEISPLNIKKERLRDLASCLICPSKIENLSSSYGEKYVKTSREKLLQELHVLLSPSIVIPPRRLEYLLEQSLIMQRNACVFHNSIDQPLSLYYDHKCGRDQIPNQTVQILQDHDDEVWFLQFSHNGSYMASASKDCTAIIWEVLENGLVKLKYTLAGHPNHVSFVAWSPDDHMILTCGDDIVKLWDVESGECKYTFQKLNSTFTACAWFPDGKKFIAGGGDKCIYMWDVEGKELDSWKGVRLPRVRDLTVSSDGKHMISIAEKVIRIYNVENMAERLINEEELMTSLSVSNDGRFLLVNLTNQEIHLWDITDSSKLLFKYRGHRQTRFVIRSSFGGCSQTFIVSGSEDSQVYIWHRSSGEILEVLSGHSGTVNCVSWNPVNPYMFASASDDHTIRIWGVKKFSHKQKDECYSNGVVCSANRGNVGLPVMHNN